MVQIPEILIDRNDLNLLQRALLPLIIRHSFGWGSRDNGVTANTLATALNTPVRDTIAALDALVEKRLLQMFGSVKAVTP